MKFYVVFAMNNSTTGHRVAHFLCIFMCLVRDVVSSRSVLFCYLLQERLINLHVICIVEKDKTR